MKRHFLAWTLMFVLIIVNIAPIGVSASSIADVVNVRTENGVVITTLYSVEEGEDDAIITHYLYPDLKIEVYVLQGGVEYYFEGITLGDNAGEEFQFVDNLIPPVSIMASEQTLPTKVIKYTRSAVEWTVALIKAAILAGVGSIQGAIGALARQVYDNLTNKHDDLYFVETVEQTMVSDGATTYYRASVLVYVYAGGYYQYVLSHKVFQYTNSYPI